MLSFMISSLCSQACYIIFDTLYNDFSKKQNKKKMNKKKDVWTIKTKPHTVQKFV